MHFTDSDKFLLGVMVGLVLACVLSIVAHVLTFWLIGGAIVFTIYLIGKRWFQKKFNLWG